MADPINPETGKASIRLFVPDALTLRCPLLLSKEQTHYLKNVMRQSVGGRVLLFNGVDGEWICELKRLERNACEVLPIENNRTQTQLPDVWLLFAPLKKVRLDYLAQKATEMGVARLQPVLTKRTQVSRVNHDRLVANTIEAAEQCGCLSVPSVMPPVEFRALLGGWDQKRRILHCDESPSGSTALQKLSQSTEGPWALLVGPEGGFDQQERDQLGSMPCVLSVSLGPRIMRADTAIVAALSLWQATLGDWR